MDWSCTHAARHVHRNLLSFDLLFFRLFSSFAAKSLLVCRKRSLPRAWRGLSAPNWSSASPTSQPPLLCSARQRASGRVCAWHSCVRVDASTARWRWLGASRPAGWSLISNFFAGHVQRCRRFVPHAVLWHSSGSTDREPVCVCRQPAARACRSTSPDVGHDAGRVQSPPFGRHALQDPRWHACRSLGGDSRCCQQQVDVGFELQLQAFRCGRERHFASGRVWHVARWGDVSSWYESVLGPASLHCCTDRVPSGRSRSLSCFTSPLVHRWYSSSPTRGACQQLATSGQCHTSEPRRKTLYSKHTSGEWLSQHYDYHIPWVTPLGSSFFTSSLWGKNYSRGEVNYSTPWYHFWQDQILIEQFTSVKNAFIHHTLLLYTHICTHIDTSPHTLHGIHAHTHMHISW